MTNNPSPFISKQTENEMLVLEFLKKNGPTSIQNICKFFELSNATLSHMMKRLIQKDLIVKEKGKSETRGPKPIILSINNKCGFLAGAIIYPNNIYLGLFTFNLELIKAVDVPIINGCTPENASMLLHTTLAGLLNKYHILESKLISLGVALAGNILPNGVVKISSPLKWQNVPLKKILSEHFSCNIIVTDLMNSRHLIQEIGAFLDVWNLLTLLYVTVDFGVGGTLVKDGKISLKGSGYFGEIGHIVVDPNGPMCGCGNKGCLESLISSPALMDKIKSDIKAGTETILAELIAKNSTEKEIIDMWGIAIQKGDPYALKLRNLVGEYLSSVVAIAVNCYAPDIIILSGCVVQQCPVYLREQIRKKISSEVCASNLRDIRIIVTSQKPKEKIHMIEGIARAALWAIHKD